MNRSDSYTTICQFYTQPCIIICDARLHIHRSQYTGTTVRCGRKSPIQPRGLHLQSYGNSYMVIVVTLIGAFTCLVGLYGLLQTQAFMNLVKQIPDSPTLIAFVIPIRIASGLLLFFAADETRHPLVIKILGIAIILAGLFVALFGRRGIQQFIKWWLARPRPVIRLGMAMALILGVYLIFVSV